MVKSVLGKDVNVFNFSGWGRLGGGDGGGGLFNLWSEFLGNLGGAERSRQTSVLVKLAWAD